MNKFWVPNIIVTVLSLVAIVIGINYEIKSSNNKSDNIVLSQSQAATGAYYLAGGITALFLGNMIALLYAMTYIKD